MSIEGDLGWLLGGAAVVGGGVLVYELTKKKSDIGKQMNLVSVTYNGNNFNVAPGQVITATVQYTNTSTQALKPSFRLDIQRTGALDSPQEGTWSNASQIAPGATASYTVSSIPVPSNWSDGNQFHCHLMLNGVSGVWDTSPLFTVSVSTELTKDSVVYNNGSQTIPQNQPVPVRVTLTNNGTADLTARLRVDVQRQGSLLHPVNTPQEGQWTDSPAIAAGDQVTTTVDSIAIPWGDGTSFQVFVMLEGHSGHWDVGPILKVEPETSSTTPSESGTGGTTGTNPDINPNSATTQQQNTGGLLASPMGSFQVSLASVPSTANQAFIGWSAYWTTQDGTQYYQPGLGQTDPVSFDNVELTGTFKAEIQWYDEIGNQMIYQSYTASSVTMTSGFSYDFYLNTQQLQEVASDVGLTLR